MAAGEGRVAAEGARQVPAHQVGGEVPQVVGESGGGRGAVAFGDALGVELGRDVDGGRGAGGPPVPREAGLGGPLDHRGGHGEAADADPGGGVGP
ncbi:hypothetical protein AB6O49_02695 [Streptomyces sp. SBR177]